MEKMSIGVLLEDLRSIKLPKKRREFVDSARGSFRSNGSLPVEMQKKLRRFARLYRRQFEELHASRARARRTLWKRSEGLSEEQAQELVRRRRQGEAERKADLGI